MVAPTLKFLCSYNGLIIPRYPDGKLRYHGGHNRVLAVHRTISFSELLVKLCEVCGSNSVSLRCQLPAEDLDALVSITSDEDLSNLIQEYDRIESPAPPQTMKIRAFLLLTKNASPPPPPSSNASSSSSISPKHSPYDGDGYRNSRFSPVISAHTPTIPVGIPLFQNKSAGRLPCYSNRKLLTRIRTFYKNEYQNKSC